MKIFRWPVAVAAGLMAAAGVSAPALAAPHNTNTFPLELACSAGQRYTVTVLEPTPETAAVHMVGSTSVLIPTLFQWHVLVTDATGTVLEESSPPPQLVHGRSAERLDTMECTFTQVAHHDWPDVGAVTIQVDGTVHAYRPR